MTNQQTQEIKQQLRLLYPELFDDDTAKDKLDPLITQADMLLNSYQDDVTDKQYEQLVLLMTAHLLYQSEDDDTSSVSIADVHFTFNNSNKTSNGTNGNGDKYLDQLAALLNSLLGANDWSIQLG